MDWLRDHNTSPGVVTPQDVREFKLDLVEKYSAQTVNLRLSAMRSFYRWAVETNRTPFNPAAEVRSAKRSKSKTHKRDALTNGEVVAVLDTCDASLAGVRDRAILTLFAYCGLRTVEVHRANIGDLRTRGDRLTLDIQGKGSTDADEFVVVPRQQERVIRAWLSERQTFERQDSHGPFFVSVARRNFGERLSLRSIRRMVKERYKEAGVVGERKTTHSLRHSAITNVIRRGGTPLQAQAMARHASMDTTLGYYHEVGRLDNPAEDLIRYDAELVIQSLKDFIERIENADEKERKKRLKEVESEAWEDFLDMTISQALLWAGSNIAPEEKPSEIQACEPYFIGSHSGASGAWVSGPEDLQNEKSKASYFWGYNGMCTTQGLFCAGDASGASSHKFSDGSHAEGRIRAKAALAYIVDNPAQPKVDNAKVEELKKQVLKPLDLFQQYSGQTDSTDVNENYIKPRQFMFRLQKLMDEYAGGAATQFSTNKNYLEIGLELLTFLKEDAEKLAAADLNELMRCWENIHRMWQAEAHVRTVLFREETRWPGYYYRSDTPKMDNDNWKCFVNCKWDPKIEKWDVFKRDIIQLVPDK
jgi:site-specific recombinase XerD